MTVLEGSLTDILGAQVQSLFAPASTSGASSETPGSVGVEVELIPVDTRQRSPRPLSLTRLIRVLDRDPALRADARITFEPGGQLELSPPPAPTARGCLSHLQSLLERVHRCTADEGIGLVSAGLSPWHDAAAVGLQNDRPRYRALQAHFDSRGPEGRQMMRLSAALQVCVDLGGPGVWRDRWQMLNRVGPALTAAFASSPLMAGRPTGQRSARTALWLRMDPCRTGLDATHLGPDPEAAYTDLALAAEAVLLPRDGQRGVPQTGPLGDLLDLGGRRPDSADLQHHLTTLFPPIRPHGYLEIRNLDAVPLRWLDVVVCLLASLSADRRATREALAAVDEAAEPSRSSWERAASAGMADPPLRRTATSLFEIAIDAMARLPRSYLPAGASSRLAEFRERFPASGRCPADELLEGFLADPEDIRQWQ